MGEMNPKYKILFHCLDKNGCRCFRELVNDQFEITVTSKRSTFRESIKKSDADAAVICLTTAGRNTLGEFLKAESYTGYLPVLSCTEKLKTEFINEAVGKGVKRFLSNDMEIKKIIALITDAIKQNELKKFIENKFPGCFERTVYAKKIIDIIIYTFPKRINEDEIAIELKVSKRWMQNECKKAFRITYKKLLRIIWIYQAVRTGWF
jgi:DNA-binding NarL/FixJ family response regulator